MNFYIAVHISTQKIHEFVRGDIIAGGKPFIAKGSEFEIRPICLLLKTHKRKTVPRKLVSSNCYCFLQTPASLNLPLVRISIFISSSWLKASFRVRSRLDARLKGFHRLALTGVRRSMIAFSRSYVKLFFVCSYSRFDDA